MDEFDGSVKLSNWEREIPIGVNKLLVRSTSIQQTEWIIALVVYTGHETKAQLNTSSVVFKNSRLEKTLNKMIAFLLVVEIARSIQGSVIDKDIDFRDPETGNLAECRNSNLNEELGQVRFILSDKTGTLTSNQMRLQQCSIGGNIFGTFPSDFEVQKLKIFFFSPNFCKTFEFEDNELQERLRQKDKVVVEFWRALSLCHTAIPNVEKEEKNLSKEIAP